MLDPQEEKAAEFSSWKPWCEVRNIRESQSSPGFYTETAAQALLHRCLIWGPGASTNLEFME